MLQVPGILSVMFPTAPTPLWSAILSSCPQCLGPREPFPQQMFFYTYIWPPIYSENIHEARVCQDGAEVVQVYAEENRHLSDPKVPSVTKFSPVCLKTRKI